MNICKTVHLYNLSHFAPLSPILAAHSVASDTRNCNEAISAHPGKTHCSNCGIMLIPGLTASTRIKYSKKSTGTATLNLRSRTLVVTCGHCSHEHHVCSLVNQRKTVVPAPTEKKKKKKKNSELSAILAARKTEAPKTLSLFEFMQ